MKTIKDAVIEHKGEWPYDEVDNMICCICSYSMYVKGNFESYTCDKFSGLNTFNWKEVCNKSDFNLYVDFLASNRGSGNVYELSNYRDEVSLGNVQIASKENQSSKENKVDYTSEEFWKDAPEGATHYGAGDSSNGKSAGWYDIKSNGSYLFMAKGGKSWLGDLNLTMIHSINSYFNPRPIQSPIYTQEMVDAGVMPSVGMECLLLDSQLHNAEYEKCTIDFVGSNIIVYSSKACTEVTVYIEFAEFKPLTPPITLIDGKTYQFECNCSIYVGFYSDGRNSFMTNMPAGNKICGKTEASNIQPLTVEGK